MEMYYGICLVIVVASVCIAALATLVTKGYYGEIENILDRRRQKKVQAFVTAVQKTVPYMERFINTAKEAKKMDDEQGRNGTKYAKSAFESSIDEMLKDNGLK